MSTTPPPTPLALEPSFGFGDRLGLAGPGHLASLLERGGPIRGIFAQQSIREMSRTHRTPEDVMSAAVETLQQAHFTDPWGADADHLKTNEDVDVTADAGFTFFTIDPSDHVDAQADDYDDATLAARFAAVRDTAPWTDQYAGKTINVPDGPTITFDQATVQRATVKYGKALVHALALADHIRQAAQQRGQDYEIELSVDETPQPTTLAEHYIIADQCHRANMKLVSLAPRYVGDFEKGIDYKGDLGAFERSLAQHAAIAGHLGPYKLSLHSGSDKLSIYPTFAKVTRGLFHVKTAGTSYLEALRAVSRHDAQLLRQIIDFSRARFESDRATYHISARLDKVAPPDAVADDTKLVHLYLDENDGRQILHVTFGSVLTDPKLGPGIKQILREHPDTHRQVLASHLGKHLAALRSGLS